MSIEIFQAHKKAPAVMYTFSENTAVQLLRNAFVLLPCITKAMAIYYDEKDRELKVLSMENTANDRIPEPCKIPAETMESLDAFRRQYRSFDWLHHEELPFETVKPDEYKLELFKESDSSVLVVPVENEFDNLHDLLLFFFSGNLPGIFNLSSSRRFLTSDQKKIIGNMVMNYVTHYAADCRHNRQVLRDVNLVTGGLIERYREANEELKRIISGSQRNMVELAVNILEETASRTGQHYILTDAARDKLKQYKGDITELKEIMEKAIAFATTLHFEVPAEEIRIEDIHIDLNVRRHISKKTESAPITSVRYAKTLSLLDKLEEAARQVVKNNEALTGVNVGRACPKAISAPAINDALKKHKNKIITLMNDYPDRWKLIRAEFRPLVNILSSKNLNASRENKTG